MRIGMGYDVHRLCADRKLVLGGVHIPFEGGLLGHSDADVLIHSLMDSLLGALALGDIGKHFPDNDDQYKDISSLVLLKRISALLTYEKYTICNIDLTMVAQNPKILPYVEQMKKNISVALNLEVKNINIKATTTENLGFIGEGKGMACYCVSLIEKDKE